MCLKKLFKRKETNVPPDIPEPIPPVVIEPPKKVITVCRQSERLANPTCTDTYKREVLLSELPKWGVCVIDHTMQSEIKCEYPVLAGNPLVGHCVGLETLSWNQKDIPFELWKDLFETMADYGINFAEFFLSCREDQFYNKNTICPVTKNSAGKFDVLDLNPDFIRVIEKRLRLLDAIKYTSSVCIFSGVKNVQNADGTTRWSLHYFNGHRNTNPTTSDVRRFMDHEGTVETQMKHIKLLIKEFDSPYRIWRLINEPQGYSASRIYGWGDKMAQFMISEGVDRNRIAFDTFDSSLQNSFLNAGYWMAAHAVGSPETVKLWKDSPERYPFFLRSRFFLSNDGGDDPKIKNSKGLRGKLWNPDFRMPSAEQMGEMHYLALKLGGRGMNTMSAAPYLNGAVPDLQKMIEVGTWGIPEDDLMKIMQLYYPDLDIDANAMPEFLSIKQGVKRALT